VLLSGRAHELCALRTDKCSVECEASEVFCENFKQR
jgi:hypothetical protein